MKINQILILLISITICQSEIAIKENWKPVQITTTPVLVNKNLLGAKGIKLKYILYKYKY